MAERHEIVKARQDTIRRGLRVAAKEAVTPLMLRIVFSSEDLAGFSSPSPDDHIKVFFPTADGEVAGRDFTPRAWDEAAGTMTLEFALHAQGAAVEWARGAKIGDRLEMGGPRGSTTVPDDFDWYVMVGDATALPSFGRRLEALRAAVPAYLFGLIAGDEEQQAFKTEAHLQVTWLDAEGGTGAVLAALQPFALPKGDGFIWIAGEAEMAREVYRYLVEERGHAREWVKAATYWTKQVVL